MDLFVNWANFGLFRKLVICESIKMVSIVATLFRTLFGFIILMTVIGG